MVSRSSATPPPFMATHPRPRHPEAPLPDLPPAPERLPHASVLGIPLALTDYERAMDWMDARVASGLRGYVTAAAVHLVMVDHEDR